MRLLRYYSYDAVVALYALFGELAYLSPLEMK